MIGLIFRINCGFILRPINLLLGTAILSVATLAQSAPVDCTIVVRSEPRSVSIKASQTPYEFTTVDFDNGFRFSGQVLEQPPRLKTYTYFDSKDRYVLIHQNNIALTDMACGKPLGKNIVYSPRLELELSYACQLRCKE